MNFKNVIPEKNIRNSTMFVIDIICECTALGININ